MRTNINLDDELIAEAMRLAEVTTKKEVVHRALEEFVARRRRLDVRELPGTVSLRADYDYKSLRT